MNENGSARAYVVLQRDDDGGWLEVDTVEATSAQQACRRAAKDRILEEHLEAGVTLRAVPQRIWDASETPLKLERTSRLVTP